MGKEPETSSRENTTSSLESWHHGQEQGRAGTGYGLSAWQLFCSLMGTLHSPGQFRQCEIRRSPTAQCSCQSSLMHFKSTDNVWSIAGMCRSLARGLVKTVNSPKKFSGKISTRAVPRVLGLKIFLRQTLGCILDQTFGQKPLGPATLGGTARGKFFQTSLEEFSLFLRNLIIHISSQGFNSCPAS